MNKNDKVVLEGGCTCGEVRYCLTRSPMIVHCCHCRQGRLRLKSITGVQSSGLRLALNACPN